MCKGPGAARGEMGEKGLSLRRTCGDGAGMVLSTEPTAWPCSQADERVREQQSHTVMSPCLKVLLGHGVGMDLDKKGLERGKPREDTHRVT